MGRPRAGDHKGPLRAEGSPAPGPGEVPPELGGRPLRVVQEPGSAGAGLEAGALGAGWAPGWVASLVLGLSGSLCSQESAWSLVSRELVTSRVGEKLGVMGKPLGSLRPPESRGAGIRGGLGVPWRPGIPELAGLLEQAGRRCSSRMGPRRMEVRALEARLDRAHAFAVPSGHGEGLSLHRQGLGPGTRGGGGLNLFPTRLHAAFLRSVLHLAL